MICCGAIVGAGFNVGVAEGSGVAVAIGSGVSVGIGVSLGGKTMVGDATITWAGAGGATVGCESIGVLADTAGNGAAAGWRTNIVSIKTTMIAATATMAKIRDLFEWVEAGAGWTAGATSAMRCVGITGGRVLSAARS